MSKFADMSLHEKLAKIREMAEVIQKNKSGYGYKYVDEGEILTKVAAGMDKYGVNLYCNYVEGSLEVKPYTYTTTKAPKGGGTPIETINNEFLAQAELIYVWVNVDKPEETLEVRWPLMGQQSNASQAVGSGMTYANRYFMLKFFQIATPEDDPDNWRSKKQASEQEEDRTLAKQIVDNIHAIVSEKMSTMEKGSKELAAFRSQLVTIVKKYATDEHGKACADYFQIKQSAVANALFAEIEKFVTAKPEQEQTEAKEAEPVNAAAEPAETKETKTETKGRAKK